jgi:hypothetical protein
MVKNSNSMGNLIKYGFGLTIGSMLAMIIFNLIAVFIGVIGYVLFVKEQKKGEKANNSLKIFGIVMMFIAVILGSWGFLDEGLNAVQNVV